MEYKTSWQMEKPRENSRPFQIWRAAPATCIAETTFFWSVRTDCRSTVSRWSNNRWKADYRNQNVNLWLQRAASRRAGPWSAQTAQHWHPTQSVQVCQERMSKFSLSSFCEVFFFCRPGCHLASNHPPRLSCWSPIRLSWRLWWGEDECIASLDSIEFPGRLSAQDYHLAILTEWWLSSCRREAQNGEERFSFVQWVRNRNVVSFHSKNETGLLRLSRRKANSQTADNRQLSENCILYDETWNHSKSLSFFKCFPLWVVVELSALLERVRVYISAVQNCSVGTGTSTRLYSRWDHLIRSPFFFFFFVNVMHFEWWVGG